MFCNVTRMLPFRRSHNSLSHWNSGILVFSLRRTLCSAFSLFAFTIQGALAEEPLIVEHNPIYRRANGTFQPLNGSTAYAVLGTIAPDPEDESGYAAQHSYGCYLEATFSTEVSIQLSIGDYDERVRFQVSDPEGNEVAFDTIDDDGVLSIVLTRDHVLLSGTYFITITLVDLSFGDNADYTLTLVGASLPFIEVRDEFGLPGLDFFISEEASMPPLELCLAGVVADPLFLDTVRWTARIRSGPGDFPYQIAEFATGTYSSTVTDKLTYRPSFGLFVVGGFLESTATITNATGLSLRAASEAGPQIRILGTNPSIDAINDYVDGKAVPTKYPANFRISYHDLLSAIVIEESNGMQFLKDGDPKFNVPAPGKLPDGGAGMFQITPPTIHDVWNWHINADSGAKIFNTKISEADAWIRTRAFTTALASLKLPTTTPYIVNSPPWSQDEMIVREGVQRYNGGNAFVAQGTIETLANGGTRVLFSWTRTPNTYHEKYLGAVDD